MQRQVCLVLGRAGLDDTGVVPSMSRWGGEAIYTVDADSEAPSAFLGQPTVVVAAIDLSVSHTVSPTFTSLGKMFVGTLLGTNTASPMYCCGRRCRQRTSWPSGSPATPSTAGMKR
jgi:hypothetical protein